MMVIFLVGLVSMILMRTLRKDYARYSKEDDLDDMVSFIFLLIFGILPFIYVLYKFSHRMSFEIAFKIVKSVQISLCALNTLQFLFDRSEI